ncbi:chorismate mutase [Cognatishimia sp. WU-CL00825]|uniref:chorismate mutase n=1 Tax=Cognatishimia sp. WU-CL00825 TaxID=3127658 RepID=UPI003105826A
MTATRRPENCHDMTAVRHGIDAVDQELVTLLVQRAGFIDRALELKKGNGWPARIPDRVEEVVENVRAEAARQGLDPNLVDCLWRQLIEWSIDREEQGLSQE